MELLTPTGVAGVAVVRVAAEERVAALASVRCHGDGRVRRGTLHLDGVDIDDILVVDRGDLGLELHVHGAAAVLAALQHRFGCAAVPPRRASETLLRNAMSEEQLDLALEQLEYDFAVGLASLAALPLAERAAAVAAARARSRHAGAQLHPARVVLVGRQNAGKSTLFNRLLARDRVVTGPLPGLTRDPIAEVTTLEGYPYELIDTAGEGEVAAGVDAAALQAGRDLRAEAIVVLAIDVAAPWRDSDAAMAAESHLVVGTKCDLGTPKWPATQRCDARISAATDTLPALRRTFGRLLRAHRGLPPAGVVGGFAALDAGELEQIDAFA